MYLWFNSLEEIYQGTSNMDYLNSVYDCSFTLHPKTKRVDIQVVAIVKTIPDWTPVVAIPTVLPIANNNQSYCGTYAKRGERMGCYLLTIYPDGRIISNFNNEGTYWDIDVFFIFETTDSIG